MIPVDVAFEQYVTMMRVGGTRYPILTGLQHIVIWQDVDAAIDKEHPTIAEALQRWNYSSHMIGKWHNGRLYLVQSLSFFPNEPVLFT